MLIKFPKCSDSRECFARNNACDCTILRSTYPEDGKCSFCKQDKEVTKGWRYPINEEPEKL